MSTEPRSLLEGLCFPEGPRWHDGKFYFSDMHARRVVSLDLEGNAETVVHVPNDPSGLGWLPDGRMLVVSMLDRRLLRLDGDTLTEVADISSVVTARCNDMVVDAQGRAYIGNFGFEFHDDESPKPTVLVMVTPAGDARVVADELAFPNGAVITPDGGTLIVAETYGHQLTAFNIEDDGSLVDRRLFAKLEGMPDGICLDAEGAVWVATPFRSEVVRLREGGEVADRIAVGTEAFACMLGGPERRTLFICTATATTAEKCRALRKGAIEIVEVDVPGAGLP